MDTRDYELMYIVSPTVADDQLPGANERVGAIIGNLGGEVADTNVWGKRRLAYPIARHDDGYYVVAKIKLQPSRARDLEAQLRISDEVIRHILIQPEEPKQRSAPKERPTE